MLSDVPTFVFIGDSTCNVEINNYCDLLDL